MEKQELQPNEQQLHGAISATECAVAAAAAAALISLHGAPLWRNKSSIKATQKKRLLDIRGCCD
jgi:hypothetical protein